MKSKVAKVFRVLFPMRTKHQFQRFAVAAGFALAAGSANIPESGAQLNYPFTTPAVFTYAAGNQDLKGDDYDITAPLGPINALSVARNGGGIAVAQASANINNKHTFMATATAVSPSPNDIAPDRFLMSSAAMVLLTDDPLGRDRVKVDVEFDALANTGSPLNPLNPRDATSVFFIEVGFYATDGYYRKGSDGKKELVKWPEVRQPPLLGVSGGHVRSFVDGGFDHNSLFIVGNGAEIERTSGTGPLVAHKKITLNVPAGASLLMTIEAKASLNGFTYVDPIVTPHPDNPEVVVTFKGVFDPNPPPLAILSPEQLTAAGIDLTPLQELGLLDSPAPLNQPPVARCHNVTVPTTLNSCAVASASIDNGSSDPEGDALTLTQSPAGPYPAGTTVVTLTASDGSLSSQCTATVTVTDGQAPTLTCPADQTATATSASGAEVNFSVNVSDNCGTVMTSCNPGSGSTFPIGATPVTCTATDGAGLQKSCSFQVQVLPGSSSVDLSTVLGNNSFEQDFTHAQWTATTANKTFKLNAPVVNPVIVSKGGGNPLQAPIGKNFIGILNPNDQNISGKLVHTAVAGSFPAGTVFHVTVWANRGRLAGAKTALFESAPSDLLLQFSGWGAGPLPIVKPNTDDWSRRPSVQKGQAFTNWAANGQWASQTFRFVTEKEMQYISLSFAGLNHKNATYIAFDLE